MGKNSKKVKRQAQRNANLRKLQECQPREAELAAAFAAEEYAKVLEILAELIQAKDVKPDLLYKGAYSYFMLGDYERAAQWVNNTLSYNQNHVEARILLARLCFMQNRHEDGLSIYDFLVENYRQTMTMEQKEQIMDSSEYYVRREADKLRRDYPNLAEFLQVGTEPVKNAEPVKEESSAGSALSALQRLKAKLQAVQAKNEQADDKAKLEELPMQNAENGEHGQIERQIDEINSRSCSLREKVQLFNKFAAAQYAAADFQGAEAYLKAALQLDAGDCQSIRNMAMVQSALGEPVKAQALAASLPEADFVLLYLLNEQANG